MGGGNYGRLPHAHSVHQGKDLNTPTVTIGNVVRTDHDVNAI